MPVSPPNLSDPKLFECRPGVPILDTHDRAGRDVDEARLRLVAKNSNARAAAGELGLLLIGHTTDDGKETDQPPLVGFVRNYQLSTWQGKPCILADLYYRKDKPQAFEFPRRSVEVMYSDRDPANNYVDAVALLVRRPERGLGLVAYRSQGRRLERYSMDSMTDASASMRITEGDIPALQDFMERNRISDTAQGIRAFLKAWAEGTEKPDPDALTKADMPELDKYFKRNNIDPNKPGGFEEGLTRYKADKRAGKLHRT